MSDQDRDDVLERVIFVCVFRVGNQFFAVVIRAGRVVIARIDEACFRVLLALGVPECKVIEC